MRIARLAVFLALACTSLTAGAPWPAVHLAPGKEVRYTVFFSTRQAGSVVLRGEAGGGDRLTFDVSDRGRGQSLAAEMTLDDGGVPSAMHVTGVDYWKNPVDDRYERKGGRAVWSNASEHGEATPAGPVFYLTAETNLEIGILAAALLRAEGGRLALLPAGEARIEPAGETKVTAGTQSQTLHLYAISGLGFTPAYLWMDERGLFFARYDGFVSAVREGWESVLPSLLAAQGKVASAWERSLALRLARRPKGELAIRGARLFDPETGKTLPGTTVVISGDRIRAVGRDGEVAVPEGAEIIDAQGKALLPGLWDMHQHLVASDGLLDIASGVTTARDMGNDLDLLLDLRRRWDAGEAVGPRLLMACVVEGPGPYAAPTKMLAATDAEALAFVNRYAAAGCVQIKIYSSLDPKLVPGIVERAHALGLRVSGHIPNGMKAEQAVREGFDEIQHTNFLFLNFLDGVDTRTPARLTAVGEHAGELDLKSSSVQAFLRLLKEKRTVIDPTVNFFEDMFTGRPGEIYPTVATVAARLPLPVRRSLMKGNAQRTPEMDARYLASFRATLALVRALHDAGIPIVAGTDSMAGFCLHRELEDYVAAGLTAPDALRAATLVPARVMHRDKDLGTIAPGKLADLILVDGDPATHIADIRRVVLTIRGGVMFDPAKVYEAIGVKPAE
ncbi:MAG TPA: amidohydrolase family protein [Thermoanaerobaculia bacterium]|jgi:imidazolonepropionase-like amidohydrolase|nr:amidohydrolase family protein [Thermoanaerobaculia bacterium]